MTKIILALILGYFFNCAGISAAAEGQEPALQQTLTNEAKTFFTKMIHPKDLIQKEKTLSQKAGFASSLFINVMNVICGGIFVYESNFCSFIKEKYRKSSWVEDNGEENQAVEFQLNNLIIGTGLIFSSVNNILESSKKYKLRATDGVPPVKNSTFAKNIVMTGVSAFATFLIWQRKEPENRYEYEYETRINMFLSLPLLYSLWHTT